MTIIPAKTETLFSSRPRRNTCCAPLVTIASSLNHSSRLAFKALSRQSLHKQAWGLLEEQLLCFVQSGNVGHAAACINRTALSSCFLEDFSFRCSSEMQVQTQAVKSIACVLHLSCGRRLLKANLPHWKDLPRHSLQPNWVIFNAARHPRSMGSSCKSHPRAERTKFS